MTPKEFLKFETEQLEIIKQIEESIEQAKMKFPKITFLKIISQQLSEIYMLETFYIIKIQVDLIVRSILLYSGPKLVYCGEDSVLWF